MYANSVKTNLINSLERFVDLYIVFRIVWGQFCGKKFIILGRKVQLASWEHSQATGLQKLSHFGLGLGKSKGPSFLAKIRRIMS